MLFKVLAMFFGVKFYRVFGNTEAGWYLYTCHKNSDMWRSDPDRAFEYTSVEGPYNRESEVPVTGAMMVSELAWEVKFHDKAPKIKGVKIYPPKPKMKIIEE